MSADARISALLQDAQQAIAKDDLQKAANILRDASHVDPDNATVKEKLVALQAQDNSLDVVVCTASYFNHKTEDDAAKTLKALRQRDVSPETASKILPQLLDAPGDLPQIDKVTSAFVVRQDEVRKVIAADLRERPTIVFEQFWKRGEEAFHAFAAVPLDKAIWTSPDAQKEAQKSLFRLCVATVIEAGVEHPDWALRAITRILATSAPNVVSEIDPSVFEVVLSSLDIRLEPTVRSQATLATAKMLEATTEKGGQMFAHFVTSKVAKQTNDDLIVAFSAAAAAFPIIPAIVSTLFMTDGFVQSLVPSLEKNSEAAASGKRKSKTLEQAALELLSAACIDKACREAINRYCSDWLTNISNEREGINLGLAALILAKIKPTTESEITQKLSSLILSTSENPQAIEGLAYTSLQPKVKEEIVADEKLLKVLIKNVSERQETVFGGLTVFNNLTSYRTKQTGEQKKMAQLKAYANQTQVAPEDPLDNDAHVTRRCKKLVDHGVVPALVACCKQNTSPANVALVVRIIFSLAKEQKHRAAMTQQGAVRLLLQIRARISQTDKATGDAALIERGVGHGLARLLISVNPSYIFSAAVPAASAVATLTPLLTYDHDSEQRDLLPTFESLLALTNLASMEDQSIHELLLRQAWDHIEDLLFSSNHMIQRAAVELVCNLMASPSGVAKFADGSNEAKRRITILLALADVEDFATRRAAGGALAMISEWDAAVTAILDAKDGGGIDNILTMCADESDEIKHRGFVCLSNIVSAPDVIGARGVQIVRAKDGEEKVKSVMHSTKDQQILSLGGEVVDKLSKR